MNPSLSLQGLCTVCYKEQPKYKCPRCKTQTCSLPCYKRHQQRASCNGQRNPAEFVKKSQWATPNGIDHDYNYLKSVERNIERAGEDVGSLVHDSKSKFTRQTHPEGSLQRYLQQNRIHVIRAPAGMTKSRENKTRVTQSGKVYWTVAWVDAVGNEFVDEDCPESNKLLDTYKSAMAKRAKAQRQKRTEESGDHASKRRRIEEPSTDTGTVEFQPAAAPSNDNLEITASTQLHFYLQRPGSGDAKVLIPLQAEQNLTTALRERTVHEIPTVYALPHAVDQLPATFVPEAAFLAGQVSKATAGDSDGKVSSHHEPAGDRQPPDPAQILEMLRRDVQRS